MAISLNFSVNNLSEMVLMYSLIMKSLHRARLYYCIINILQAMAQFINFGKGFFWLKTGFFLG